MLISAEMHVFDTLVQGPLQDLVKGLTVELLASCVQVAEFEPRVNLFTLGLARDDEARHLLTDGDAEDSLPLLGSHVYEVSPCSQGSDVHHSEFELLQAEPALLQLLDCPLDIHSLSFV